MRRVTWFIAAGMALVVGACASDRHDERRDAKRGDVAPAAPVEHIAKGLRIGLAGAIRAAGAAFDGTPVEAEAETGGTSSVVEVTVVGRDGAVVEVVVDGSTGKVLRQEAEDDADEIAQARAVAAQAPEPGTLFRAVHRAEGKPDEKGAGKSEAKADGKAKSEAKTARTSAGKAIAAALEIEDGVLVSSVTIVRDGAIDEERTPVRARRKAATPGEPRAPRSKPAK